MDWENIHPHVLIREGLRKELLGRIKSPMMLDFPSVEEMFGSKEATPQIEID